MHARCLYIYTHVFAERVSAGLANKSFYVSARVNVSQIVNLIYTQSNFACLGQRQQQ